MQSPFEEVFTKQYSINQDIFKVGFYIKRESKLDAGMMPYHFLEVQKLPELNKYIFHNTEGADGKYSILPIKESASKNWTEDVHRQLLNSIKKERISSNFFLNPDRSTNFF